MPGTGGPKMPRGSDGRNGGDMAEEGSGGDEAAARSGGGEAVAGTAPPT